MRRLCLLMHFLTCISVEASVRYTWDDSDSHIQRHISQSSEQHLMNSEVNEVIWPGIESDPDGSHSNPFPIVPIFAHFPAPQMNAELLRPIVGKHEMPHQLEDVLFPKTHRLESSPAHAPHHAKVEVTCGSGMILVRVHMKLLEFKGHPSMFSLGTCPSTSTTPDYLDFRYPLKDCGSKATITNGKLVYVNSLSFSPGAQDVYRHVPLNVSIHCQYDRFHYSYKVGYIPQVRERIFVKRLKTIRTFNLTALNAKWHAHDAGEEYKLGEVMNFELSTQRLSKNQRVFVDSCHVTRSKDPNSVPRLEVIGNFGCMKDSTRDGSHSRFVSRQSNSLRFSIDSFLLTNVDTERLFLHCRVRVGHKNPMVVAKSCNYNRSIGRWEELHGQNDVCSCCQVKCGWHFDLSSQSPMETLITSAPWRVAREIQAHANPLLQMSAGGQRRGTEQFHQGVVLEVMDDIWK